jgi:AraC-like DNA-binding protein
MANELLTSAGLTVEQTARQLGYADTSSFVHAYRRWTGTTPGQLRQLN